jgi:hypothetical protein
MMPRPYARTIPALALAGLMAAALVPGADPAGAKPTARSCRDTHGQCLSDCVRRYPTTETARRCTVRTCDKQFDTCLKEAGGPVPGSPGHPRTAMPASPAARTIR